MMFIISAAAAKSLMSSCESNDAVLETSGEAPGIKVFSMSTHSILSIEKTLLYKWASHSFGMHYVSLNCNDVEVKFSSSLS